MNLENKLLSLERGFRFSSNKYSRKYLESFVPCPPLGCRHVLAVGPKALVLCLRLDTMIRYVCNR